MKVSFRSLLTRKNCRLYVKIYIRSQFEIVYSDAGTGGARGAMAPPIFGRSVNPIPTGEGRLSPPINTGTPNVFHLPASLKRSMYPKGISLIFYRYWRHAVW